jgi:hypothetical protein
MRAISAKFKFHRLARWDHCPACDGNRVATPDYDEWVARFAPTLGVTLGSCVTPTPAPIGNLPWEPPSGNVNIPNGVLGTPPAHQPLVVIGVMLATLALLLRIGWLREHFVES